MLYNIKDVTKEFTDKVAEYIAKGYRFAMSMSGHQGEEMKVDVENGKGTVRIRLESFSDESFSDYDNYVDGLELIVEVYDRVVYDIFSTLWSGKGKELYNKRYYSVTSRNSSSFSDSLEEIESYKKIRRARAQSRKTSVDYKYVNTPKAMRIAYNWAKRQKGYKSISISNITGVERLITPDNRVKYEIEVSKASGTSNLYMRVN